MPGSVEHLITRACPAVLLTACTAHCTKAFETTETDRSHVYHAGSSDPEEQLHELARQMGQAGARGAGMANPQLGVLMNGLGGLGGGAGQSVANRCHTRRVLGR